MTTTNNHGRPTHVSNLGRVLLAGLVLTLLSGRIRGPEPDRLLAETVLAVGQGAVSLLVDHQWCHPVIASAIVNFFGLALFGAAMLLGGDVLRRLPTVAEFLVESDLGRRRGRRLSAVALALGYSLPFAAALALAIKSSLSLFAVLYFLLAYGFCVFSTDGESSKATLTFYARFRNALARDGERDRRTGSGEDLNLG
jgi:hypothetical protein